jgi:hypothetical protein
MKYFLLGVLLGTLMVGSFSVGVIHAQNPNKTPFQITSTAPCMGNQNVSVAGQATYCFGSDGAFQSINGGAIGPFVGLSAITLQGVTKQCTPSCTFTLNNANPTAQ